MFVTFYLTNRKAKEAERRQASRAADGRSQQPGDTACSHTTGPIGDYALFSLRKTLYTTYMPLHEFESFKIVDQFYIAVEAWRKWGREHDDRSSEDLPRSRSIRVQKQFPATEGYMTRLRQYGEQVITILKDNLEDAGLNYKPPMLPALGDISTQR